MPREILMNLPHLLPLSTSQSQISPINTSPFIPKKDDRIPNVFQSGYHVTMTTSVGSRSVSGFILAWHHVQITSHVTLNIGFIYIYGISQQSSQLTRNLLT